MDVILNHKEQSKQGEMMTRVYLIRHGQTDTNIHGGFNGMRTDLPLNETGEKMVQTLTPVFAEIPLDVIYVSPLRRAMQTAEWVRGEKEVPMLIEPQMQETDFGLLDGLSWKDGKARYPRECRVWIRRPERFHPPGSSESVHDVWVRVFAAFLRIVRENRGKTVAIVAHGMVFTLLTSKLLGLSLHDYRLTPMPSNAAYRVLDVEDDGHVYIDRWEYDEHLEPQWVLSRKNLRQRLRRAWRRIPRRGYHPALRMTKKELKSYGN